MFAGSSGVRRAVRRGVRDAVARRGGAGPRVGSAPRDGNARWQRKAVAVASLAALALLAAPLLASLVTPPAAAQQSARVIQRNLAALVTDAGTIVHGRVLSVRVEPHPQHPNATTLLISVEVIELLKGQSGAPFTYRQYIWDQRDAQTKLGYKIGEEVLLLMLPAHPQTGLSSPAGLEQGRFRFSVDAQGNKLVSNGFNNAMLFRGLDPATNSKLQSLDVQARTTLQQHRSGPLPYDQLKLIIQALAANSAN